MGSYPEFARAATPDRSSRSLLRRWSLIRVFLVEDDEGLHGVARVRHGLESVAGLVEEIAVGDDLIGSYRAFRDEVGSFSCV